MEIKNVSYMIFFLQVVEVIDQLSLLAKIQVMLTIEENILCVVPLL